MNLREQRLLEALKKRPDLFERVESILELAKEEGSGPVRSADEVESLLIEELRKLGNETLSSWGASAEDKVSNQYRADHGVQQRGKKN